MTHLFTVLFFAGILGAAIAILWSVVDENRDLVMANMPWKERAPKPPAILAVRKVDTSSRAYWAVPSISSSMPIRARTVSPAMAL